MLSINTNTSFSEKSKSDETASNEESPSPENIFAAMFSTIEDPEKKIMAENSETTSVNIDTLMKQFNSNNSNNSVNQKSQNGTKTGPLSNLALSGDFENYKTLPNENGAEAKKYTVKFELVKEAVNNISEEIPFSKQNEINSKNDLVKSLSNLTDLKNYKIQNSINEETIAEEDLQEQLYKLKGIKAHDPKAVQDDPATFKKGKKSREKDFSKSPLDLYLSKNFVKQANLSSNNAIRQNLVYEQNIVEEPFEFSLKQGESNNDISTLTSKQINSTKGATQQPSILSNSSSIEAQLKMLEKNWGTNLARIVENALREGREKIDIQLEPQKLGRLTVTLSMSNHQTSIIVSTENTAAALLLNGAEERLSQMFEASGLKLSNFQANANSSNNPQDQTKQKSDKNGKSKIEVHTETESPKINENATNEDHNNKRNINIIA